MAREEDKALALAEHALADALRKQTSVDGFGYCERAEDNLIATIGPGVWRRVKTELASGKGAELNQKFRAAFSSSALVVNAFAPLLGSVDLGEGLQFHGDLRFEQERSAWAPGYQPTLDAIVEAPCAPARLYVESKCIEFLRDGHAHFSEAFVKHAEKHLGDVASQTFRRLFDDPFVFDPVDGRQLAKHFLAARRTVEEAAAPCKVVLLCITWEPADAGKHSVFGRHREGLQKLADELPDPDVRLVPLTYRQLWDHWDATDDVILRRHTRLLRDRYDISLGR